MSTMGSHTQYSGSYVLVVKYYSLPETLSVEPQLCLGSMATILLPASMTRLPIGLTSFTTRLLHCQSRHTVKSYFFVQ